METLTALSDRVTVLEEKVDAVRVRMGTLETGLKALSTEVHDGFARVDAEFVKVRTEMQAGFRALEYQINATADHFEAALHKSEERIITATDERTQSAIRASEERTHAAIKAGDEETRRYMRALHEDVIDRIGALAEGR